jgi:SDR family mycofactocin-dependent oxidoreductase
MEQLNGKIALVTGGARGQGRAYALALAAAGATVVVCDIAEQLPSVPYPLGTKAELAETVALITAAGGTASASVTDVRDSAAVSTLVEQIVAEHGSIDILIANAAICTHSPVADISDLSWTQTLDTNLSGPFYCIRAVLPHMRSRKWGRIVVISSGAGRMGMTNLGHYAATKWGLIGLTKTVALEVATEGITANVVCPTTVGTPMVRNDTSYQLFCPEVEHPTEQDALPRLAAMNPMRKPWLEPEDVSRAVMYLVTEPGYTSGTVLEVSLATSAYRT